MDERNALQGMSLEQIKSVIEIMQQSSDAYMYILDLNTDTYILSEKATKRFPFYTTMLENCAETLKKVVHPSDYEMLLADLEKCRSGEKDTHALEYRWMDRMNRVVWISCRGTVVTGAENHRLLIGTVSELGKKAKADNVTGLRREAGFRLDMGNLLQENPGSIHYMMRIGIDNFKEINEKEGIEAGDEVLRELAECILKTVEETAKVYRLVADEFMLVDEGQAGKSDPHMIYRKIQQAIAATAKRKEYSRFYTVSAGVLEGEFAGKTVEEIMRFTEFALNEAKRSGRNQMKPFVYADYEIYLKKLDIRKALRQDVNNDFSGFEVYYQPIVSASEDYKLIGAEALLRWKNEKFENVSPAVFIPILEESGLIIPVGRYVLWEAARACKKWQEYIPEFHINDLKARNIDLALDDFGTGYSNMRYLKEIDFKTVKIDRSFVVQALHNEYDFNIISHIIDMVHSLGSVVCMEGIEEKEELSKMMAAKPDMIQGYYFGKPSPAERFEKDFLRNVDSTGVPQGVTDSL